MDDDLIESAEGAAILGITAHAVRWMAGHGRLPHVREVDGRIVRYAFHRADVLARAAERGVVPGQGQVRRKTSAGTLIGSVEAARMLGVTRHSVAIWAKRGIVPAIQFGGAQKRAYRFERTDIEAFVERSRVRPRDRSANGREPADA